MSEKKYDDKRCISRGKFYVLHLDSEIMSEGVEQLNENKVGAPFVYSDTCFMITALFRNTVGTGYRQMQGIIEDMLGKEKITKLFCHLEENQQDKLGGCRWQELVFRWEDQNRDCIFSR